jgi:hypothetical protein
MPNPGQGPYRIDRRHPLSLTETPFQSNQSQFTRDGRLSMSTMDSLREALEQLAILLDDAP